MKRYLIPILLALAVPAFAFTSGNVVTYSDNTGAHVQDSGLAVGSLLGPTTASSWPASFGSTPTSALHLNVNNYPIGNEIPAGVLQGITSSVVVKSDGSYTQVPWPPSAIAAYIMNTGNSTSLSSSTAFFGAASQNQSLVGSLFGGNVIVQNCAGFGSAAGCPDNAGYNANSWAGFEIDANIVHTGGGGVPTGALIGLKFVGASAVQPTGGSWATEVAPLGTSLPWTYALHSDDGGSNNGIFLGASATAGTSIPSQGIDFRAYNSSALAIDGTVAMNQIGTININAPTSGSVSLQVNGTNEFVASANQSNITGHVGFTGTAPGISSCGSSPSTATGSTDSAGVINIGSGSITSCVVTFNSAYIHTPFIVLTPGSNVTLWVTSASTTGFTINSSATMGSTAVNYHVDGI